MHRPVEISVVIPAKNEARHLSTCLDSIRNALGVDGTHEVIVVDNNSTDDTVKIAEAHNCIVVKNETPGPASSRNAGASAAHGLYIAFIDADCRLDPLWFEYAKGYFRDPGVVMVGTKISPDFDNATWVERTQFLMNARKSVGFMETADRVQWLGTSNMLVRKTLSTA